ncbi:hypothetical protein [Streptomyces sp. RerS4]|uniref:hypothetical protein n=1 Tax=Streptomyces sp. RerS4 TaxID=2942449 RepID=UPI00201C1554|nr:hypothetical protein [Streptomyces sp. RerS4]UQX05298.1 hypothetical protein M4D82_32460 [Streptomyces sp. RerS4]
MEINHGDGFARSDQDDLMEIGAVHAGKRLWGKSAGQTRNAGHFDTQMGAVGVVEAVLGDARAFARMLDFDHDAFGSYLARVAHLAKGGGATGGDGSASALEGTCHGQQGTGSAGRR